jgi:hypothetical protein
MTPKTKSNGRLNGHANGHVNGHTNGEPKSKPKPKPKNGKPGDTVLVNAHFGETDALRARGLLCLDFYTESGHIESFVANRHVLVTHRDDSRVQAGFAATSLNKHAALSISLVSLEGLELDDLDGADAILDALKARAIKPGRDPGLDRPTIEVTVERHEVVEKTIDALASDPELFARGQSLGVVIREATSKAKLPGGVELTNAEGTARFSALSESNLSCHLTRSATFVEWRKDRSGEDAPSMLHPPDWLIKAIATRGHWPNLRQLVSITVAPFVREDGSLLAEGYDGATGTLYRPTHEEIVLPDRPTQADAREAGNRLYAVVHQFPFESGFDFSVWFAALLTGIQRPLIAGPTPGFAFIGNKAGCGKGLLIDVVGIVVWGFPVGTRSYPFDPREGEKTKLALALAGVPVVHFDNLPEGGGYGGTVIDSCLTSIYAEGRILGKSRDSGPTPLRPVWFLSGNNVHPFKDAYRRWLPCNLVTTVENPHERGDITEKDLRAYVRLHRVELLRDALTILKAHALAGRPTGDWAPLGSYEEWDRIIRGAVWFASKNDCLTTQRKATVESPERQERLALLEGWAELPEGTGKGHTADEAIEMATGDPKKYGTLNAALMRLSRDNKPPTRKQVGRALLGLYRMPVGNMRIEKNGETRDHATIWRIATL